MKLTVSSALLLCGLVFLMGPSSPYTSGTCTSLSNYYYYRGGAASYYGATYYRMYTYHRYRTSEMSRLARYHRAYTSSSLGKFYIYYTKYSYHSRLLSYDVRLRPQSQRSCANFESNTYGDFMGYFLCPLPFEPANFTTCCGKTNYKYCCPQTKPTTGDSSISGGWRLGLLIAGVIVLLLVIGSITLCCYWHFKYAGRVRPTSPSTTFNNPVTFRREGVVVIGGDSTAGSPQVPMWTPTAVMGAEGTAPPPYTEKEGSQSA